MFGVQGMGFRMAWIGLSGAPLQYTYNDKEP